MLTCQKQYFEIPSEVVYLNSAYMSPLPKNSAEAGIAGVRQKLQPWNILPSQFASVTDDARGLFAQLIGATGADIAIIPSVSYGIAVAGHNIPVAQGQSIVVLQDQFPSNIYEWHQRAAENQAQVITVARPTNGDWTSALLEAIDDKTAIVACPHTHWTDGGMVDLVAVGAQCRKVGAALVIDGTQSVGVLPFDIKAIQPDFLVCATYKWLLGPYSYGFLYVAPQWQGGKPLEQTWMARQGSDNFARLVDYQSAFLPGARRFDVGEPSNFALTPIVVQSLQYLVGLGTSLIIEYIGALTATLTQTASELGLSVIDARYRSPHLVGLGISTGNLDTLAAAFAKQNIYVSVRGQSIRVSPHVYNDAEDISRFTTVLKQHVR